MPVRIFSLFLQKHVQLSSSNKNRLLSGFPLSLESKQAINLQFIDSFLVVVQLLRVRGGGWPSISVLITRFQVICL